MQKITPQQVRQGLHLPDKLQNAYERVVVAGMKVMFDKATRAMVIKEMQQPGEVSAKLGKSISGLMILLFQQSNKTLPPQVLIPAGIELLVHAAEFLEKTGQPVTNEDIAEGTAQMIGAVLKTFGVDANKVLGMVSQFQQAQPAAQGDA